MSNEPTNIVTEVPQVQDAAGAVETVGSEPDNLEGFSRRDVRRNMNLLVTFNVIFAGNIVLIMIPINPLLVVLKATNTQIGWVNGAMWAAILAQILCPYVSRWFSVKRWFLLGQSPIMNLPQILTALIVMYPLAFHMANSDVLLFFIIAWTVNWFTSGFFFMPFQELIMNSLPRSVIGRFNGLSNSLGTVLGIAATLCVIAYLRFHSDTFHIALVLLVGTVLFWAQIALVPFLKEKPANTTETPVPWSREMLRAAWENKPFIRLLGINAFMACTVGVACMGSPVSGIGGFVGIYAMKGLHMSAAQAVSLGLLTQVVAVICAGPVGFILDKYGAKRLVSTIALTGLLSNLCLIFIRNQWGVYVGVAFAGNLVDSGADNRNVALLHPAEIRAQERALRYSVDGHIRDPSHRVHIDRLAAGQDPLQHRICDRGRPLCAPFPDAPVGSRPDTRSLRDWKSKWMRQNPSPARNSRKRETISIMVATERETGCSLDWQQFASVSLG